MAVAMRTMTPMYEKYRDPEATSDTRTYSMFMHIVSALILVDPTVVLHFVATLVMWLSRGKDSPFIDDHGREAVNFQISCFILTVGGTVALVVLAIVSLGVLAPVAALLGVLGGLFMVVLRLVGTIRGAIAAHRGELYRYPMCIRVLKG